jgi:hypothetical protein
MPKIPKPMRLPMEVRRGMGIITNQQTKEEEMSKFACFIPNAIREEMEDIEIAESVLAQLKANRSPNRSQSLPIAPKQCCTETDMNGHRYTQALIHEDGMITCVDCGGAI